MIIKLWGKKKNQTCTYSRVKGHYVKGKEKKNLKLISGRQNHGTYFSWSKWLLFFLHRITSVTPPYSGSYPAQLFRAHNTSHPSLLSRWVLDIIEHNWNTQKKQKPQLIRHFDWILLKLIRRLSHFWSLRAFQGFWLFWSSSSSPIISKREQHFSAHPLIYSVSPRILFSLFWFFFFWFCNCK